MGFGVCQGLQPRVQKTGGSCSLPRHRLCRQASLREGFGVRAHPLKGLGCRVSGFKGLGFRVSGFRGLGFRVLGLEFRV